MFVKNIHKGFVVMPEVWNIRQLFEAITLIQTENSEEIFGFRNRILVRFIRWIKNVAVDKMKNKSGYDIDIKVVDTEDDEC